VTDARPTPHTPPPATLAEVREKIERATAEAAAKAAARAADPFAALCRGSDEVLTVEHLDRAKDYHCQADAIDLRQIAAAVELLDSAETGPRFLWLPPWDPWRLLDPNAPPRPPIPDSPGASSFGRKRRARRARGRQRQLRAATSEVRAWVQRLRRARQSVAIP
jgi:hypothetical protein